MEYLRSLARDMVEDVAQGIKRRAAPHQMLSARKFNRSARP